MEAPPAARPQTRAPRALALSPRVAPGCARAGTRRPGLAGWLEGVAGKPANVWAPEVKGPGWAAGPRPFVWRGRRARARSRASRLDRKLGRAGGRGFRLRPAAPPPAPPGPQADRARSASRGAENWAGIKVVGAGERRGTRRGERRPECESCTSYYQVN